MKWIISLALIIITISKYWFIDRLDFWWHKWLLILICGIVLFSYKIYEKYHWSAAVLSFWIMLSGVMVFASMDNQYVYLLKDYQNDWVLLRYYSAFSCFCFLILGIIIMRIKKYYNIIEYILSVLCIANSLLVLFQWALGAGYLYRWGFTGNGSINACLIAFTYPLLINICKNNIKNWLKIPILSIPIIAIFCTLTSIPVGVLFISIATYIFLSVKGFKKKIFLILVLTIGLFGIGHLLDSKHFFNSSLRFGFYKLVFNTYLKEVPLLQGSGTGTFNYFGPMIQIKNNYMINSWMPWLHNDWLQILFENGIIGGILSVIVFIITFLKSITQKRYHLSASIAAYGACMVFNYPLHYAIHAFVGMFFIATILRRDYVEEY